MVLVQIIAQKFCLVGPWNGRAIAWHVRKIYSPNQLQPRWFIEGLATYEETIRTSGGRQRNHIFDMWLRMPALEGRSRAVSSDVADTIEGLMPSLMDIFCGADEVVRFEPVGAEDEAAAQQESDYVNHVFMQQNPGFMILYSFIKDALLSKVGIVKVWWEEREEESRETYYDLTEDQFALLAQAVVESDGAMRIVAHTVHDTATTEGSRSHSSEVDKRDHGFISR